MNSVDVLLRGRKFKKMVNTAFEGLREEHGLKQIDIELLLFIENQPDASASDIRKTLDLNKGHVSTALFELCQKGFLLSCSSPEDRRYVYYRLTEKGQAFIEEAKKLRTQLFRQLFRGVTPEEHEALCSVMNKLRQNIEEWNPKA